MIEWVVLGSLAWIIGFGVIPIACAMFKVDDPYIPSREYAEDFAAHLSGHGSPGSDPLSSEGSASKSEPGDVVDVRRLGAVPRASNGASRQYARPAGRSGAEKDRPLKLVP